jgi:hypothetical protein
MMVVRTCLLIVSIFLLTAVPASAATVTVKLDPRAAEVGQTNLSFVLEVTGTSFGPSSIASLNGSARQVRWSASTPRQLAITLLPGDVAQVWSIPPTLSAIDKDGKTRSYTLSVYPPCGTEVGSVVNGIGAQIKAYSNGTWTGTGEQCRQGATTTYGLQYECPELIRRYYDGLVPSQYSPTTSAWRGDAITFWNDDLRLGHYDAARGLAKFANGDMGVTGSVPRRDDIIAFQKLLPTGQLDPDSTGHVAIITSASGSVISILEQNWNAGGTATLTYDHATNRIGDRGKSWRILGWVRSATAPSVNHPPTGSLDGINALNQVFGWGSDPDDPNAPISVHLYIDLNAGTPGATPIPVTANQFRSDVGNHAFNWDIPSALRDGRTHTVWAWGIDLTDPVNNNVVLPGSPKTFNISTLLPVPTAANDVYSMTQGTILTVPAPGVLTNDTIPSGFQSVEFLPPFPSAGLTNIGGGGFILDLSPNPSFTGTITLQYVIHAAAGDSNVATATVQVDPVVAGQLYVSDDSGESWRVLPASPSDSNVITVVVAPSRPSTLYAVTDKGIYISADTGTTWQFRGLAGVFSITVDPTNPDTVYALGFFEVSKSIDGGAHWSGSYIPSVISSDDLIAIDPNDRTRLYITTDRGLLGSTDSGLSWSSIPITGRPPDINIAAISIDPRTSTIYIGLWYPGGGAQSTDSGATWTSISGGYDVAVAIDGTVYSVVPDPGSTFAGVRKMPSGSAVSTRVNNGFDDPIAGVYEVYFGRLAVSSADPNVVYASFAVIDPTNGTVNSRLYKTVNAGGFWRQVTVATSGPLIIERIAVDPVVPTRMYLAGQKHLP